MNNQSTTTAKPRAKRSSGKTYVFYNAHDLSILGESDNVKEFVEQHLKEEVKSYSGIYRTNQLKDGSQLVASYRGMIMRVKGHENEIPFPEKRPRHSSNRRENEWDIYDAFTHKIVETTSDIRGFCAKHDLGKNAHVQIYRTTHFDESAKRLSLPIYKGFFIRISGDANQHIPFPPKKAHPPKSYDVFKFPSCELVGNYKDLKDFMREADMKTSFETYLRKTGKPDPENPKKAMSRQYLGYFVRQVGNDIKLAMPTESKHPMKGSGQTWCIFDKNLNLIKATKDLQAFAAEKGWEHYKPLYETNRTKRGDKSKSPILAFYHGFLIRPEKEMKSWNFLPFPDNSSVSHASTSSLDMIVWRTEGTKHVNVGRFVPSYQKTFELDTLDKPALYELAKDLSKVESETVDGLKAVFVSDLLESNEKREDTLEFLSEMEIILPREIMAMMK
ncbi:hypothetical protein LMH73_008240 [Vibrio splendidus]|nr:hypothetical protein [Vibrio splendidus]MCC4880528.1 hypothetical protein [Vibrio splendidus]